MRPEAILKAKISKLQENERFLQRRHLLIILLLRRIVALQDELGNTEAKLATSIGIASQIVNEGG